MADGGGLDLFGREAAHEFLRVLGLDGEHHPLWASLIQISSGVSPGYLSSTVSRFTSAPLGSISPTADESPPAPQSVTAR